MRTIVGRIVPRSTAPRRQRRGWSIHGYVGANGGGKSAAMVWDTIPSLEAGRPVLSTVRLLDYLDPRPCEGWRVGPGGLQVPCEACEAARVERRMLPVIDPETGQCVGERVDVVAHGQAHPLWTPFTDWAQLLSWRGGDVLMDEVTGVASSRESHSMPAPVANQLMQMRRADVVVRWSAPNWRRADILIREVTQAVTYCRGYLPKSVAGQDRLWRQRRLFRWRTFDADSFEDFTAGKREALRSMVREWHYGPGSTTFTAYDTFDQVLSIGTVSDAGRCYHCGGRRTAPACSCADYTARQAEAKEGRPARAGRTPAKAKPADGSTGDAAGGPSSARTDGAGVGHGAPATRR